MPHEDHAQRHAQKPRRTVEHRLAGGHHRKKEGCAFFALLILAVPVGLLAAGVGFVARIVA